ncbi:LapA family protein [Marinobacterium weihaiense]|uniref:LapA family protein n=1 Tax=Marinobacterium weihaiense TaxID=2851016 RepID=A0ABS6MC08_9GAMM|nr:LapA family protein [Marinobacterium weihaiense]MBV0933409.1 LapA family protein [Marinobacterium weihaiense]
MNWLKKLVFTLLALIVVGIGILFTIHNTQPVSIDLVFFTLPEASLSLWLIAVFVLGAACGLVLSSFALLALKTRLRSGRRKEQLLRKELDQLRTAGLKD